MAFGFLEKLSLDSSILFRMDFDVEFMYVSVTGQALW